ncbi:TPA: hypothetical protein L4U31_002865 [Pseudomonas aeruginosa]|nr:hypothetical protein [Pseudomonas aeruginosa]
MAYYTGSALSMSALRSALIDACTSEGWTWNASTQELIKGTVIVKVEALAGGEHLQFIGRATSGSTVGESPVVRLGRFSVNAAWSLSWPMTYHVHVFPAEVYIVAVYDVDKHLWGAFGKSTIDGLAGSGTWVGASVGSGATSTAVPIAMAANYGPNTSYPVCPALFHGNSGSGALSRMCWVHHNLDGLGWHWGSNGEAANPVGMCDTALPLLGLLPNTWNSEAVLLPLRTFVARPSGKISLIADCEHARATRVDNYAPGQVIDIGGTRWKIYPWFQKNSAARAGGSALTHTGTFGWAVKYEGP